MGKTEEFDNILDRCIDRINRGGDIKACLADYPQYARELAPLLMVVARSQQAYAFTPSGGAKSAARTRFTTAIANSRRQTERRTHPAASVRRWSAAWAAAAAVVVIAIAAYLYTAGPFSPGLGPTPGPTLASPGQTSTPTPTTVPTTPTQTPAATGYMVLLLSDEVNDIGDFQSLVVTVSSVGFNSKGAADQWIEFVPQAGEADLTMLQGDAAMRIWSGDIPEGEYDKAFIRISKVTGILKGTGMAAEVVLPSDKLQISKPFRVNAGQTTHFVYDVTVIKAGQSGKYILKPQLSQSGADQAFNEVDRAGKPVQSGRQGQGKPDQPGSLSLAIVPPNPAPGASVTLTVTFQGQPEPGVEVTVNGQVLPGRTGQDGKTTFTVPSGAQEFSISAKKGQNEGRLTVQIGAGP